MYNLDFRLKKQGVFKTHSYSDHCLCTVKISKYSKFRVDSYILQAVILESKSLNLILIFLEIQREP
jgi:hypothetical protein